MIILNMLNEYYIGMNKTTSTSVATRVESEAAVSDNTVWNDSENSTSDYTADNSDDYELNTEDQMVDEVCNMIWDGWASNDPVYPEYDDITYGMVMDYLFEDSNYYYWDYDYDTDNTKQNIRYS